MTKTLGELEHRVLLAALRLGQSAYTSAIAVELESCTGRQPAAASVYIALRRLEQHGYVASQLVEDLELGGQRERRYFRVTESGLNALRNTREQLARLWDGLESLLDQPAS